jgi:hypothetical protein
MSMSEHQEKKPEKGQEGDIGRRAFVAKTAAIAGAAGVAGATGLAASAAAQRGASRGASSAACGPNPRTMTVTFDFHSTSAGRSSNFQALAQKVSQSQENVLSLTRRCTDDNGWGEWLRDASGDPEAMDLRAISFRHVPFRTGA